MNVWGSNTGDCQGGKGVPGTDTKPGKGMEVRPMEQETKPLGGLRM